jgi:hypothetical protein
MLASAPLARRTSQRSAPGMAVAAALIVALLVLAPASHDIAHGYASETRKHMAPLQTFEDALARLPLPAHACQVYVLDAGAIAGLAGYADAIAKGLAADPARLAHCLIATEQPPYAYFVRAGSVEVADYRPLRPLTVLGNALPWVTLGDTQALYFTMPEDFMASLPGGAIFLAYSGGAFVDVSAAVRSGERKVAFVTTKAN